MRSFSTDFSGVCVLEVCGLPLDFEGLDSTILQLFGHQFLQDDRYYEDFLALCDRLLGTGEDAAKIESYVVWLHLLLTKRFDCEPGPCHIDRENRWLAASIKQMLDGKNDESPPHEQIAQKCGCSKEHCNRVFKQVYQLSMQAYFLNRKAARAKVLLDSGVPLAEVALRCGFYDQSHFIRVFKGLYQVSPRKYRQAISGACHSHTRKSSQKHICSLL